jgi:hypothetical protein
VYGESLKRRKFSLPAAPGLESAAVQAMTLNDLSISSAGPCQSRGVGVKKEPFCPRNEDDLSISTRIWLKKSVGLNENYSKKACLN